MRLDEVVRAIGAHAPGLNATDAARPVTLDSLTLDSREVRPGALFAALPGSRTSGGRFIAAAVAGGAVAVLAEAGTVWPDGVPKRPLLLHSSPRRALALLAARLAGPLPARVVAVTGTNGKTSTVEFLRQIWQIQGVAAASLGTLGVIGLPSPARGAPLPSSSSSTLTTPDSVSLARTLAGLAAAGVTAAAIEASSHGLQQGRLDGLRLAAAGFSNLTRDHLDYHGSEDCYRRAKLRLFDAVLPEGAVAAANADMDPLTLAALREIAGRRRLTLRLVGEHGEAIRLLRARPLPDGQLIELEVLGRRHQIMLALPGRFQVDNVVLAAILADPEMQTLVRTLEALPHLAGVRGRMQRAATLAGAAAYVDYAHTPDALARLLEGLRPHALGKLVVVFGAGGDRDRGKRPLMGAVAQRLADLAIVTDDNPRSEPPAAIRAEILAGCPEAIEIGDRAAAIAAGLEALRAGDVLVVAGKGHEQGQIVGAETLAFDDADIIRGLAA